MRRMRVIDGLRKALRSALLNEFQLTYPSFIREDRGFLSAEEQGFAFNLAACLQLAWQAEFGQQRL